MLGVEVMISKLREEGVEFLFEAILKLETIEECYSFFEDLCTVPELRAMSQRLVVAKMLSTKFTVILLEKQEQVLQL